jgi:type VI secretion system protein ImpG
MFVELTGLTDAVQQCQDSELDILILLGDSDAELEGRVDAETFALFCTPAVNLFPKRADRIHLSDRFSEFHVVPDRTRPLDFEVYEVLRVIGHGATAGDEREFLPFYSASDDDVRGGAASAYYAVSRVPRAASAREKQFGRSLPERPHVSKTFPRGGGDRVASDQPSLTQLSIACGCGRIRTGEQ